MMQTSKQVVVFDLDDTLYKEVDYLKSAYREIAASVEAHYALKGIYAEILGYWQAGENVFQRLIEVHRLDLPLNDLLAIYRNHQPTITLDSATRDLLEHLRQHATLALITDGRSLTQRNKITALGLTNYMEQDNMLISEETGYEKPSEEPFRRLMRKYPGGLYYYVGDNPSKDFVAPNRLGWTTICLRDDGRNIHSQQQTVAEPLLPQYRIDTINEIENIIIYG